jgi:hypothetical protein
MRCLLLAILFASLLGTASSQDIIFRKPPRKGPRADYSGNPSYLVGEVIEIEWTSDIDEVDVYLVQELPLATNVFSRQFSMCPALRKPGW